MKQSKIENRHAKLAAKRKKNKDADPTWDFDSVVELMKRAVDELSKLPDSQEYTMESLDRLESVRHEATRLRLEVDAIFDCLQGREFPHDRG